MFSSVLFFCGYVFCPLFFVLRDGWMERIALNILLLLHIPS